MLLAGMRAEAGLIKYDIPCGGRFPKEQYSILTERVQSILSFISLISVASASFQSIQPADDRDSRYVWVRNLRKLVGASHETSQSIATLLSLLSASLRNGQPLRTYIDQSATCAVCVKYAKRLDSQHRILRHHHHLLSRKKSMRWTANSSLFNILRNPDTQALPLFRLR